MKQRRVERCFNCNKQETLLVRYILATRLKNNKVNTHERQRRKDKKPDKRVHIKKLYLKSSDYEKKTITQTYMFICANPKCWRFMNFERLKEEWDVKVWRSRKKVIILPPNSV